MSDVIKRFQIQTLSAQIHRSFGGPLERQCHCLRSLNGHSSFIDLYKSPRQKRAYYKGLQTCASVFSCPICAVKITEHRKKEIETLLERTQHLHHYLITLTIPHYAYQSCREVRRKFMDSRRRLKNWQSVKDHREFVTYRKVMKHYRYDGSVTTVEVTHGPNGWHIHSHELVTMKDRITDLKQFRDIVFANWTKSVLYSGIEIKKPLAFWKRAVTIDELRGDHLNRMTSYLAKIKSSQHWGAAAELSKSIMKKADNDNLTPFGMLHKINDERDPDKRRFLYKKYGPIFWEYCQTFKGSHFISFSKGFKHRCGLTDLTDEEVVNSEDPLKDHYGGWHNQEQQWKDIKKLRLRGFVIEHSDKPWNELIDTLNLEITLRKALQNEKQQTNKQRVPQTA